MFSKAKRFEPLAPVKNQSKDLKKSDNEKQAQPMKSSVTAKVKHVTSTATKSYMDVQSQCSSHSVKSFVTPKPLKAPTGTKVSSSMKKPKTCTKMTYKAQDELIKAQEVEIRNKDQTISEYNKQIEELKNKISFIQTQIKKYNNKNDIGKLDKKFALIKINDGTFQSDNLQKAEGPDRIDYTNIIDDLNHRIFELEEQCAKLEQEACNKQLELSSLEVDITIRDSLCKDLQEKLTNMENCLEETRQQLEMVKGHHSLALEANESIRREYKVELETLKVKLEEEKQMIICKGKADQESVKAKYVSLIESIKIQMTKEKNETEHELQKQLANKEQEIKAKLAQIDEATHEKLRLCEIQFEERTSNIQEHCEQQQKMIQYLEKEIKELTYNTSLAEEQNIKLQRDIHNLKNESECLKVEKSKLIKEMNDIGEDTKNKVIDYQNEMHKLTAEVEKANKEKSKFEMSVSWTRDIVQVLTNRLRDSDNELELLEGKVEILTKSKEVLENELSTYKNTLNRAVAESNEYKEALVNILRSKAQLAKEHTRIMEHNVSLIESLQNVEKEAYRELGSIKSELIEDVELLKKESNSQIQMLLEEVENKRILCKLATEHAGVANAAAEQSRVLLSQAASEITRLEAENQCFQQQIQDQQSLVVELSLLRQENEELTMTVAKQSSIIDKFKKDLEVQHKPKSPSVIRKTHKLGKENLQAISPLRERNQ